MRFYRKSKENFFLSLSRQKWTFIGREGWWVQGFVWVIRGPNLTRTTTPFRKDIVIKNLFKINPSISSTNPFNYSKVRIFIMTRFFLIFRQNKKILLEVMNMSISLGITTTVQILDIKSIGMEKAQKETTKLFCLTIEFNMCNTGQMNLGITRL